MTLLRIPNVIANKRDGNALSPEEIAFFIQSVTDGTAQPVQIGAMLMAMYLRGLNHLETASLTKAMLRSGQLLQWPTNLAPLMVDKHSTGGVGDKISLILAPALAACGLKVPMISGRGLGFTGGTIDKLESIPGFQVVLPEDTAKATIEHVGCFIMAQSDNIVPADKILYASRDVTNTVDCIPLITASILSKKAAESLSCLLLDLKCGRAAFMKDEESARALANSMVAVGRELGIRTAVAITRMNAPLGRMIGNALEVRESLDVLRGSGPSDIVDLTVMQGGILLHLAGKASDRLQGENVLRDALENGTALRKFCAMLIAQGVDEDLANELCFGEGYPHLPVAEYCTELQYDRQEGVLQEIDGLELAHVSGELGAGRTKAGDSIDYAVGLELLLSVGDFIKSGQSWIRMHHRGPQLRTDQITRLQNSITVNAMPFSKVDALIELLH